MVIEESRSTVRVETAGRGVATALVSIVIPVYNSAATIGQLCETLIRELAGLWRLQIILVDDGSRDGSYAACQRLHELHPEAIGCVRLSRNFGEHNAVMAGLNFAEGDYCVVMDDDLQNPPREVIRLLEEAVKGYDVVYATYEDKQHSQFRNLGSRLHNWMATHALGKPADLYLSSFKVMSRFVVREAIQYTGPDPYLDAIILRTTRHISTVAVEHRPRANGKSGYTLKKLIGLWGNMIVTFSLYPLRVLGAFGLVMAAVGAAIAVTTLVRWLSPGGTDPTGYEKLHATFWFFRGSILLAISIVGEYVGRIYMHLNRAPQFIIRHALQCRPESPYARARP